MHPSGDSSGNQPIFPQARFHIRWIHKWKKTFKTSQALHASSSVLDYLHRFSQIVNLWEELKTSHTLVLMHFLCNGPFFLITQDPMCLQSYAIIKKKMLIASSVYAERMADAKTESHMIINLKN